VCSLWYPVTRSELGNGSCLANFAVSFSLKCDSACKCQLVTWLRTFLGVVVAAELVLSLVLVCDPLLTLPIHFNINGNRLAGPCIGVNDWGLGSTHVAFFVTITFVVAAVAAADSIIVALESMFLLC